MKAYECQAVETFGKYAYEFLSLEKKYLFPKTDIETKYKSF